MKSIMLSVIILNVIMLIVIMLSVVAPFGQWSIVWKKSGKSLGKIS
jgi:hypothetical protein